MLFDIWCQMTFFDFQGYQHFQKIQFFEKNKLNQKQKMFSGLGNTEYSVIIIEFHKICHFETD